MKSSKDIEARMYFSKPVLANNLCWFTTTHIKNSVKFTVLHYEWEYCIASCSKEGLRQQFSKGLAAVTQVEQLTQWSSLSAPLHYLILRILSESNTDERLVVGAEDTFWDIVSQYELSQIVHTLEAFDRYRTCFWDIKYDQDGGKQFILSYACIESIFWDTELDPLTLIGQPILPPQKNLSASAQIDISPYVPTYMPSLSQTDHSPQPNIPRCPTCGSTNLHKITTGQKALSVWAFGLLSQKVKRQFHCNNCGYEW